MNLTVNAVDVDSFRVHAQRMIVTTDAHKWLGTPFMHSQRLQGVGVDCAQLLIACYCDTGIVAPVEPEYYAPDWFRHQDASALRAWIESRCARNRGPALPGDIVLFRFGRSESHCAIAIGNDRIIHALARRGVVVDSIQPHSPLRARLSSVWTPSPWCDA